MQVTASGVHPNESEDLNNAEKGWVADTLNDFVAGFNIGMPLEDVLEDGSLVIWGEPVQGDPAQVSSLGTRGKEHVIELAHVLDPSGSSLGVLLGDDLEQRLMWVDSPP
jgi:hypothetical protein